MTKHKPRIVVPINNSGEVVACLYDENGKWFCNLITGFSRSSNKFINVKKIEQHARKMLANAEIETYD